MLGAEPEAVPAYTRGLVGAEPARGPAGGGGAASRRGRGRTRRGRATWSVLRMREGGVAKHVGVLARVAARACDADPRLFRPRRRRVAADAGLVAADRRGLPLSREEPLMATLLLSAAGLGARRRARRHRRRARHRGARQGDRRDARRGDRPAAARDRLGAGRDRAGRAVPGDGIERGRADARGSSGACRRGRAADLVEPLPRVGQRGGGRRQGRRRPTMREYSYSVSIAVALCEGAVLRVGRIWADGHRARSVGRRRCRLHAGPRRSCPTR